LITIQLASAYDLVSLASLFEELVGEKTDITKMRDQFYRIQSNPNYVVLVAKERDSVVGSVMGVLCHDLVGNCNPFMVLENVIVRSHLRGKGIGRRLMERIEEIATDNKCNYIMFVSRIDRKEAHKFYESVGYGLDVVQGFKKYL
jgi:predicted N-acetyltransferase YhbS